MDCTEFAQKSFAFGLFSTFALWRRRNTTTAANIEAIDDGGEGEGAGDGCEGACAGGDASDGGEVDEDENGPSASWMPDGTSPGCPMAPLRCVQNKTVINTLAIQNLCAALQQQHFRRISAAGRGSRIQNKCHMSDIYQAYVLRFEMSYVRYIPGIYHLCGNDVYMSYTRHIPVI